MSEPNHAVAIPRLNPGDLIQTTSHGTHIETLNVYGNVTIVEGNASISIVNNIVLPLEPSVHQRIQGTVAMLETHTKARFRQIQHEIAGQRTQGTNQGFIAKAEVQQWRKTSNGFIWIRGAPGAGKTYLLCGLVEWADADRGSARDQPVVCVYLRYTEQLTTWDIVLGIIVQLVQYCEGLPQVLSMVEEAFKRHKPSLPDLCKLLDNILPLFKDVDVYVDGLDEAMDTSVQSEVSAILSSAPANVIVTSRALPLLEDDIKDRRSGKHLAFVEVSAEDRDLRLFVEDSIRREPGLQKLLTRHNLRKEVEYTVQLKAEGMFLHAALHMRALRDCGNICDIREVLDNFPSGIDGLYSATVQRIRKQPSRKSDLALRALIWVVHAKRLLTADELLHAVAVSPASYQFDGERLTAEEYLISICCGLICIEENSQGRIARLIHYTGQHALMDILSDHTPRPIEIVIRTCLTRTIQCGTQNFVGGFPQLQACFKNNPLLEYAHQHGPQHVREGISTNATLCRWIKDYVRNCKHLPYRPHPDYHVQILQPLHIAILFGIAELVQSFTKARRNLDLRTTYLNSGRPAWSSLLLAAAEGCQNIVEVLVGHYGLDPNSSDSTGLTPLMLAAQSGRDGVITELLSAPKIDIGKVDYSGRTALMHASEKGQARSVQALLEASNLDGNVSLGTSRRASLLNHSDNYGKTALFQASFRGHSKVVQILISFPETHVNRQTKDGWTPLIAAASCGHDDIVARLLAIGTVQVNQAANDGQSALIKAASKGHSKVVWLLLGVPDIKINQQDSRGCTALVTASINGHDDILERLLAVPGVLVDQVDKSGESVLLKASRIGHPRIVDLLLSAQSNQQTQDASKALLLAVNYGYTEIVGRLLAVPGVQVNIQSNNEDSALVKASRMGFAKIVKLLLSVPSIHVNQRSGLDGCTALLAASSYDYAEIVELLLAVPGVQINQQANDGESALIKASWKGHTKVVRMLLAAPNIQVNQLSTDGYTALIYASLHNHPDIVELLLGAPGVKVNQQASDGDSALIKASWKGHTNIVRLLLAAPYISVNQTNRSNESALVKASHHGYNEIVELLLGAPGIKVNQQANGGESALSKASWKGHPKVVRLLLAAPNIQVNQLCKQGYTALIHASSNDYPEIVELLLGVPGVRVNQQANDGESALIKACRKRHLKVARALLVAPDIQPNQMTKDGSTALIDASLHGYAEIVELLLGAPRIQVNQLGYDGESSLIKAVGKNHPKVVQLLLDAPGIQVNQQDMNGRSALNHASWSGHDKVVELLLGVPGVQVNQQNKDGDTPLIRASRRGNLSIVDLLLNAPNIDVNLRNNAGDSALSTAYEKWHPDVVQALLHVPGIEIPDKPGKTSLALALDFLEQLRGRTG